MSWLFKLAGHTGPAVETDPAFKAARVSIRPAETLGWNSLGLRSGAVTGVAANAALFSFRNMSANPVIVRRVGVGFIATTGFTAAQELGWGLMAARNFTTNDTGGTAIALTGNNTKHRSSLATPTSIDCRIATTAALGAGAKALDANMLTAVGSFAAAAAPGAVLAPSHNNLLSQDSGDHPLVLAQNEGFNVVNLVAMGAGGVGTLYVNIEVAEAPSY